MYLHDEKYGCNNFILRIYMFLLLIIIIIIIIIIIWLIIFEKSVLLHVCLKSVSFKGLT
jgi:hypothetical protein